MGQAVRRSHHLAERETMAATDERHRIARELHDSVTQTLYSVAMVADRLPQVAAHDPAAAEHQAGRIRSMTLDALGDLRVLLLEMRQAVPEAGSLGAQLHQLAATAGAPVRVELDVTDEPGPPPQVTSTAYRIAHQAVANARRHAGATEIVIALRRRGGAIVLTVADDGVGFAPGAVPPGRHGLAIMRERAASVDGELRIGSAPGEGTSVRFTWPALLLPSVGADEVAEVVEP
jgi:signal transduction histidine kinase